MAYETLKTRLEFYDATSRTLFIDAVEHAGRRMANDLERYVDSHPGREPRNVAILAGHYSPFLAGSQVQRVINERGLNTHVSYHHGNPLKLTLLGFVFKLRFSSFVFDLDKMAEEYFSHPSSENGNSVQSNANQRKFPEKSPTSD